MDVELAHHCLRNLGQPCPITSQRADALRPETCDGLSIRDTLFAFLVQALDEGSKPDLKKKFVNQSIGQAAALAYAVALIDNPYGPDVEGVMNAAKMEVEIS